MKNRLSLLTMATLFFAAMPAKAQFMIGVQGSYHSASDADRNDQIGKGLQAKMLIKNKVAVGLSSRTWFKNYEKTVVNNQDLRTVDIAHNMAAMVEVYFGNKIRPYVGADIGAYITNVKVQMRKNAGSFNSENKRTYFGMAPKAGVLFNTGVVSPFIQAQYNFLFDTNNQPNQPEITNANAGFATIDAGIVFNIKGCNCNGRKK